MNPLLQNPDASNWFGRKSTDIEYWHQATISVNDLKLDNTKGSPKVGILGYAGEEGVIRNQGRLGTSEAPKSIRNMMGSLAFHLPEKSRVFDYGDVITLGGDMESSHDLIAETVKKLLETHHFPVIFGGGHDLAYAHARGIYSFLKPKEEKLGIINLDAHFDLRTFVDGKGHSGSPFYQLAKEFEKDFNYLCLGIQKASNPKSLFKAAEELQVNWMSIEDFQLSNWEFIQEEIIRFIDSVNKLYVSIDLDGFSSAFSPGVSAPSPIGFNPEIAFKVFELIASSKKLISLDLVELNPKYDQDNCTAKLAARCAEFVLRKVFK
ncbi:formimidoylglutamase [Algoriphagus sp.]|uniref:formimidoylglutamase n=1 Tax=Algoriphagus sp. TaxID=1872435 RepID=UPI0025F04307|nr:formimidoylglutamase [Algoriphagus sp.]